MINSVLELTGVEASPIYLPRIDDVGGKGAWQDGAYAVKHGTLSSSSDAVPAALSGEIFWYDSGTTESSEVVWYEPSGVYAKWNNGSDWLITAVADVGGTPTNYFRML